MRHFSGPSDFFRKKVDIRSFLAYFNHNMNKNRRKNHKNKLFRTAWEAHDLKTSLAVLTGENGTVNSYIKNIFPEISASERQDIAQDISIWLWKRIPEWIGKPATYVTIALYNKIRKMSIQNGLDISIDSESLEYVPSVESVLIDLERQLDHNKNIDLAVSSMHPRFGQTIKEILSGSPVSFGDKSQKWRHVRAAIERFRLRWEALDLEFQKR